MSDATGWMTPGSDSCGEVLDAVVVSEIASLGPVCGTGLRSLLSLRALIVWCWWETWVTEDSDVTAGDTTVWCE